jgi:chromosome segregation protein
MAWEKLDRDFQWREEQIVLFSGEIDEYQVKMEKGREELELLDSEILAAQQRVDSIQEQLQNLPIDALQSDLAHWSTRLEILQQGLRAAQSRLIEREQLHSAAATRLKGIEHNILQIQESRAELVSHIEELKENSQRIALDIESSGHKTTPAEAALEEIETKLSEFLRLESKERVLTSQAEQVYTQAKITQIRKQEALDGLRRQIEADFGLVAFEYHDDVSGPTPLPLEGIVEDLPMLEELRPETEDSLKRQRARLRRIGPINPEAQAEYQEVDDRYEFLSSQVNDLQEASEDVQRVIAELDEIMQREFCNTFDAVADEFHLIFGRLFGGGSARLILTDPDDLTNTGIDIEARLPGRREQGLSLLSGGERSLTAVALVFSLLRVSPTPFCVLDEVDAMLDEANVGRFRDLLRELSETTQFIMITHNRATVQVADIIYGVTMGRDSTSQILSLKVDELEKVIS